MLITVHFIGSPATDQTDAVAVDAGAQEGHGAAGPSGANVDVGGRVSRVQVEEERRPDAVRNVGRQNVPERASCMVAESVQGSVECCADVAEGDNSRGNTVDRAEMGGARPAVANGFVAYAVFVRERLGKRTWRP